MKACGFGVTLVLLLVSCTGTRHTDGRIDVSATPVPLSTDPDQQMVGGLRYLGGVQLSSRDRRFGGFSGLRVRDDGWALAVSDTGAWAGFRLVEAKDRLVAVAGFHMAPILDQDGKRPASKSAADAESVELGADGTTTVTMEQDHRIVDFATIDPSQPASFDARPTRVSRPDLMTAWPRNGGAETYAALAAETRLVIAEDAEDTPGVRQAALFRAGEWVRIGYRGPAGFSPTDAVGLGGGRALILHRRFTPADGVSAVVSIADFASVRPGDVVSSREIARFKPPLTVDNMEAIAIRRDGSRTLVYLMSDDNQARAQRTLLLKFELGPQP